MKLHFRCYIFLLSLQGNWREHWALLMCGSHIMCMKMKFLEFWWEIDFKGTEIAYCWVGQHWNLNGCLREGEIGSRRCFKEKCFKKLTFPGPSMVVGKLSRSLARKISTDILQQSTIITITGAISRIEPMDLKIAR